MTINLESLTTQLPQLGRGSAVPLQARQQQWLYELEQALLARGAKKPAQPDGSDDDSRPQMAEEAPQAKAPGLRERRAGSSDTPAAMAAGSGVSAVLPQGQAADAPVDGQVLGAASAASTADIAATAPTPAQAGKLAAVPQTGRDAALPVSGVHAQGMATVAGGVQPGALAVLLRPTGAAIVAEATLPSVAKAGAPMAMSLSLGAAMAPNLSGGRETGLLAAAEQPDAQPQAAGGAEGDDYADRLLHVYRGVEGVQAWVRDASLGQAQAYMLAQSLAAELGSTGERLAALTINGRRLALPSDGEERGDEAELERPASATPATENSRINVSGAA